MKCLLIVLLTLPITCSAQSADFLALKKGNKTIRNIFSGRNVQFVTTGGAYRDALITGIKNDSIYLQEFLVYRVLTVYGTYMNDTAGSSRYVYHYKEVSSFGKKAKKGFNVAGSGAALLGGGALLTIASGVSYLADKDKFSPELLGAGIVLGGLGYLMSTAGKQGIVIGRKYTLQYIKMSK